MTKIKLYTPSAPRFSLAWWAEGGRNFFFVALVTLLIWVYADMDVADKGNFQATVVLTTGDSADVELLPPREVEINFTEVVPGLPGPEALQDRVRRIG